ncbi:hypothetical protein VIGAN_07117100 [Vigna angularis var. angularis]|uniref:Uncharacterized protein n=1 Tax=Vigna angularis var. angularis TaxID=157739 RepID=A0A0S3SHX7_PHAAN|nr:hypothetical protein VIGAN_07117100 [Vigna angularis var. angularis]
MKSSPRSSSQEKEVHTASWSRRRRRHPSISSFNLPTFNTFTEQPPCRAETPPILLGTAAHTGSRSVQLWSNHPAAPSNYVQGRNGAAVTPILGAGLCSMVSRFH